MRAPLSSIEVRVLCFLQRRSGETWKSKAIARELELDLSYVCRGLIQLSEAGLVDRVSKGRYRAPRGDA